MVIVIVVIVVSVVIVFMTYENLDLFSHVFFGQIFVALRILEGFLKFSLVQLFFHFLVFKYFLPSFLMVLVTQSPAFSFPRRPFMEHILHHRKYQNPYHLVSIYMLLFNSFSLYYSFSPSKVVSSNFKN